MQAWRRKKYRAAWAHGISLIVLSVTYVCSFYLYAVVESQGIVHALIFTQTYALLCGALVYVLVYPTFLRNRTWLKRNGFEAVADDIDLKSPTHKKAKFYCGQQALFCKKSGVIVPYDQIAWVYWSGGKPDNGMVIRTTDGAKFVVRASQLHYHWLVENGLARYCGNVLVDYTVVQRERYHQQYPQGAVADTKSQKRGKIAYAVFFAAIAAVFVCASLGTEDLWMVGAPCAAVALFVSVILLSKSNQKTPRGETQTMSPIEQLKRANPAPSPLLDLSHAASERVRAYWQRYPFKSDGSVIPPMHVAQSDHLRREIIGNLFRLMVETEIDETVQKPIVLSDVQLVLKLRATNVSFARCLAFERANGTAVLMERSHKNDGWKGVYINREQYTRLVNGLVTLQDTAVGRNVVEIMLYHGYTLQELKGINGTTWANYVAVKKEMYAPLEGVADEREYEGTLDDLKIHAQLWAVYQGHEYPMGTTYPEDYVADLRLQDGKILRVDVRELEAIRKRIVYVDIQNTRLRVAAVGRNSILIPYERDKDYHNLGLRFLDPRDFGPAWEADMSMIDAVTYKKESVYTQVFNRLQDA